MRVALGLLVVSLCPAADFTSGIQPLLKKRCIACHGQAMRMNGLRLDTGELVLKGGCSGATVKDADSMPASTHCSFQPRNPIDYFVLERLEREGIAPSPEAGRDHHPNGYSMWLTGGGIKGGQVIGATGELAFGVTGDKVHVHDLQATILHCLGMEHTKLTYRYMGRDFRLTDVAGEVVKKMLT